MSGMRELEERRGFKEMGSGLLGFRPNKLKTSLDVSFSHLITSKSIRGYGNYPINNNKYYFRS